MLSKIADVDLSGYVNSPMSEVLPVVEQALQMEASDNDLERVGSLLFDRTLSLLREASRTEIVNECASLGSFLSSETGRSAERDHPVVYGSWTALSDLLGEAARRSDRAAVESILRSYKGYAREILEIIAQHGSPVSRSEIRSRLELSESHLSHILRDLDEADLVVRYRDEGRGILVDLGPVGREMVAQSIVPAWIDAVVEGLKQLPGREGPVDTAALEDDLLSKGAPSRLVAHRLAEGLSGVSTTISRVAADNIARLLREVNDEDPHFAEVQPDARPVSAFSLN